MFRLEKPSVHQASSTCILWETGGAGSLLDGGGREAARGRSTCNISVRDAELAKGVPRQHGDL